MYSTAILLKSRFSGISSMIKGKCGLAELSWKIEGFVGLSKEETRVRVLSFFLDRKLGFTSMQELRCNNFVLCFVSSY